MTTHQTTDISHYHAHIYWKNSDERAHALSMRPFLQSLGCEMGRVHDQNVGPHPLPMYQALYTSTNQQSVETYLRANAENLSILLHEDIGIDHVKDHTDGARWIGEPLQLDLEFLETFQG